MMPSLYGWRFEQMVSRTLKCDDLLEISLGTHSFILNQIVEKNSNNINSANLFVQGLTDSLRDFCAIARKGSRKLGVVSMFFRLRDMTSESHTCPMFLFSKISHCRRKLTREKERAKVLELYEIHCATVSGVWTVEHYTRTGVKRPRLLHILHDRVSCRSRAFSTWRAESAQTRERVAPTSQSRMMIPRKFRCRAANGDRCMSAVYT